MHSPASTPPLSHKNYRDRVLMRLNSNSKLDPRSPSAKRTPLHLAASDVSIHRTPPSPFSLGDPRSPLVMLTPLALSTQEVVVVPDDIVIVAEEEKVVGAEVLAKPEESTSTKAERPQVEHASSSGAESTSKGLITEKFSPDISPSVVIMSLVNSPLHSPMGRKRKDLIRGPASLSPLKKSYSAPVDENAPPSPLLCKNVATTTTTTSTTKTRTPLTPLSQRAMNTRYCVGVQPIKFRMDPGILG